MSVAVSSEYCLLVEASSCLETAERPQWPRVYSLGRPRSRGRMPSLVGDSGQVVGVLGWALTGIRRGGGSSQKVERPNWGEPERAPH